MATQFPQRNGGLIRQHLAQQPTTPHRAITLPAEPVEHSPAPFAVPALLPESSEEPLGDALPVQTKKLSTTHVVALVLMVILGLSIYVIWHATNTGTNGVTQQQFAQTTPALKSQATPESTPKAAGDGKIQVYIVGAVKHPGVYTLEANARLYQLLQAAGGPLPGANLVAVNLAARLSDGQEVYVLQIGETPPASSGSSGTTDSASTTTGDASGVATGTASVTLPININTASAPEMRQGLHISSTTAQTIISYRLQHGPFTSVEELSQVVSKTIYNKIKGQVTV